MKSLLGAVLLSAVLVAATTVSASALWVSSPSRYSTWVVVMPVIVAPVWKTTRRRAVWLGINLLTAFLASYMIGLFEGTLEKVVALAVLMPIVASMGGIAGNQTLTLVIRGMALGHVGTANARWLLTKEISVGFLNGILWSAVVGAIAAT